MSMIRGKLEAQRDVAPQFVIIGESDFVRDGNTWKVNDQDAKIDELSVAFFDSNSDEQENTNQVLRTK